MKKSQISEIKNTLFPSDTKFKIRFKRKTMFCETIVHKWDIVTIHFRLLNTITRALNTHYRFYRISRDHKEHHQLCCTIECFVVPLSVKGILKTSDLKNTILQSPLSLICRTNRSKN